MTEVAVTHRNTPDAVHLEPLAQYAERMGLRASLAVGMMLAFAIAFGLFALIANGRRRRS